MPVGIIINSVSVLIGGLIGTAAGKKIPDSMKKNIMLIFGLVSIVMGITYTIKVETLPAVILAVILGTAAGLLCKIEKGIVWFAKLFQRFLSKLFPGTQKGMEDRKTHDFISAFVVFCASGTGIFGALQYGITGDASILLSKSILDFFSALIFAVSLGMMVSLISVPQFLVMLLLFGMSGFILPHIDETMLLNFSACGGILMLATGLRIADIKPFPIAAMLPAMILVMPLTYFWPL